MKKCVIFSKVLMALFLLFVAGCQTLDPAKFQDAMTTIGSFKAAPPCNDAKKNEEQKEVCAAQRYAFSLADNYNAHVKRRDSLKFWFDMGLIGIGSATAASIVYEASTTSLSALALGGATVGGFRTYLTGEPVSAAYILGASAQACVALSSQDFSRIPCPNEDGVVVSAGIEDRINRANALLNSGSLSAGSAADIRVALQQAVAAAETVLPGLKDSETAYVNFASTMIFTSWTIDGNTFKKARGAVPDVTSIVADITKTTRGTVAADAAERKSNEQKVLSDAKVPQSEATLLKQTYLSDLRAGRALSQSAINQAKALKGMLIEDVDRANSVAVPMMKLLQKVQSCALGN